MLGHLYRVALSRCSFIHPTIHCVSRFGIITLLFGQWNLHCLTSNFSQANVTHAVWNNNEGDTKTETSRKPVPLPRLVVEELKSWRSVTLYRACSDYLFPFCRKE